MTWYRVTRDVAADEPHNHFGRAVAADFIFPEAHGPLYGAIDLVNGIALENADGSAFEFPRDAVEPMVLSGEGRDTLASRFGDLVDVDPCGDGPIPPEARS